MHKKSTQPLIELRQAGLRVGERWLVRDLDIALHQHEIVTLIGPNGAGKTTTVRLLLGIIQPTCGQRMSKDGVTLGYIPQRLPLDWSLPLSVLRFMRLTNTLSRKQALAMLDSFGVAHLIDAQMRQLSGGELQRVQLARVVARKPQLLLLDEPVQGVDYKGEAALYSMIAEVRQRLGCGICLVSHDLHMVMAETDRVVCINGHICCQGTPHNVVNHASYQYLFGEGAHGLVPYKHQHNHVHLQDGSLEETSVGADQRS